MRRKLDQADRGWSRQGKLDVARGLTGGPNCHNFFEDAEEKVEAWMLLPTKPELLAQDAMA